MKIQLAEFDDQHYATNIVQSEMILKWNTRGNTHSLIVRGPFGDDIRISNIEKQMLEQLSMDQVSMVNEFPISNDRYVTFIPKGYVDNYNIRVTPAAYAVFCCSYNTSEDTCTLFIPNDACLYQCNVVATINIRIEKQAVKRHFFSKRQKEPKYSILIPSIPRYVDNSFFYMFKDCEFQYPITKAMLGKEFSVTAYNGNPPRVESAGINGNGYRIVHI